MLLSAGMTAKQAVLYNVLSSVLCFLGMVMGVLLGQVHSASAWIFSAVAGMFLYISLADMVSVEVTPSCHPMICDYWIFCAVAGAFLCIPLDHLALDHVTLFSSFLFLDSLC